MNTQIPPKLRGIRNFISIAEIDATVLKALLTFAIERKHAARIGRLQPVLQGKALAMLFQKPSLRTRLSFERATAQLGGQPINLEDHQVGLGTREAVEDVARVISSMCDGIMARVYEHSFIESLAAHASVPVINGLSDEYHPCQAGADAMTLIEHFGELAGRRLTFVGDGFNVARSLAWTCAKLDMVFVQAAPAGYELTDTFLGRVRQAVPTAELSVVRDPAEGVRGADVVVTDTWTSMGQEDEKAKRLADFEGYQVNAELLRAAKPEAVVLHCLPAYRNVEITDEVIDGPQSLVFPEAENRLHFQRALLEVLL
ncbi:MAG: ornithine carbamoyltransferase [Phycisphaerae bacterium]|nr:ornithine carbamoyltransferase [Phycisphaerae bacterium]